MAGWNAQTKAESRVGLWRFIEEAQRMNLSRVTAYGAYKKAGGTVGPSRFRQLWRLGRANPFRWRAEQ